MYGDDATPAPRCVILNADDFGACAATNAAVLRAHTEGVLTSASLMVAEPSCDGAVAMARDCPSLDVGLHLVLTDGRAASEAKAIPGLLGRDGRLAPNPAGAGPRWYFSRACRREIAVEVETQFERCVEAGVGMSHVNGHQHVHLHPVVWREMMRRCAEHGVRWVRVPWEELRGRGARIPTVRLAEAACLRTMAAWCRRDARRRGMRFADRVYGHLRTGDMRADYVVRLLGELGGQVNELYFHPGTAHAQPLGPESPGMDVDLDALVSQAVRRRIDDLGLRPAAYGEL